MNEEGKGNTPPVEVTCLRRLTCMRRKRARNWAGGRMGVRNTQR